MTKRTYAERVHTVCDYLRKVRDEDGDCRECPREVDVAHYGKGKQMCRALAEEMMSLVIRGTPYPPDWDPDDRRKNADRLLLEFFGGDARKMELWWQTPNPLLGNVTPQWLVDSGKASRLYRFVETQCAENQGDTG